MSRGLRCADPHAVVDDEELLVSARMAYTHTQIHNARANTSERRAGDLPIVAPPYPCTPGSPQALPSRLLAPAGDRRPLLQPTHHPAPARLLTRPCGAPAIQTLPSRGYAPPACALTALQGLDPPPGEL